MKCFEKLRILAVYIFFFVIDTIMFVINNNSILNMIKFTNITLGTKMEQNDASHHRLCLYTYKNCMCWKHILKSHSNSYRKWRKLYNF